MPSPPLSTLTPFVARFDRATVLAPGLFVSLDKRKRRGPGEGSALQVTFVYQKLKRTVSFSGPEQLGVSDLRVLQGLMSMATAAGMGRLAAGSADLAVLKGGWQELVRACGVRSKAGETVEPRSTSGRRSEQLQKSLQRLASVRVTASDRADGGEPLVSADRSCDTRQGFRVSFCAELMGALGAGSNGKQYLKVDMVEARELRADVARLLHFRLSNVNEGTSREFTQGDMEHMIWGADEADTDAIRKHRRRLLAQAVAAVGALEGWKVQAVQGARGTWVWRVSRAKPRGASEKRKT
ncbi:hypothetical protein EIP75_22100 [Aquabacterium soli]|uniref:Replication protein C n=1 Tax=Aquabacterium soli TaxID=2493092 RepID=A0A3R8SYS6_9BURK|nr:replication protein C, IncQ-type [Aquabacterium soli]RRS01088.1 hypothetical protein EIP75_22100 [Aquabacterium soli]